MQRLDRAGETRLAARFSQSSRSGKGPTMRFHVRRTACLAAAGAIAAGASGAPAAAGATPEQAKAFAERAAAHIEAVGEERAFADFTRRDGGFVDGELYVFC